LQALIAEVEALEPEALGLTCESRELYLSAITLPVA
jgi:hypothetical protein